MSTIYHWNKETFIFSGESEQRLDPVEKKPLTPAFATTEAPPAVRVEGQLQVRKNGQWVLHMDNRGMVWNKETLEESLHNETGSLPSHLTDHKPSPKAHWLGGVWMRDLETTREEKRKELHAKMAEVATSGIRSRALGRTYLYSSSTISQTNLLAMVTTQTSCNFWCTSLSGSRRRRFHSAKQLARVGADFVRQISQYQSQYERLLWLLQRATTVEGIDEVGDIQWAKGR